MLKKRLRRLAGFSPLGLLALGLVLAPSASTHPANTATGVAPHWSCRASAGYANLVGSGSSGHVEPGAANGNATSGADSDECQTDDALFPQPTVTFPPGGGDPGSATENAPFAQTRIVSDFSYKQKPTSAAGVDQVTLSGQGHSLSAKIVRADASGGCKDGQPVLAGSSTVADLVIDNESQGPDDGKPKVFGDGKQLIVAVDEQTVVVDKANGGKQLIQRALHVVLAQDASNYVEFVIGEAKAGYHGDATQLCTAPAARCPEGATYDQTRGVCIVTVTNTTTTNTQAPCPDGATRDANGACIIVVGPPSTQPGTGGNVIPLGQVLGVRKTSPCRNKRFGRQVGIVGTEHGDRITGSNKSDRIFVFGGNDRVSGGRGNDCIEGGLGSDQLDGSNGSDWLLGGAGNDQLAGGQRADWIYGGDGNDKIIGGTGNDRLFGGKGRNKLDGGKGNDIIVGGPDRDYITGGNGRDRIRAGKGNDDINVANAGAPARVDCGAGVDTIRINNNEIRTIKHCERILVTTRLSRLKSYNKAFRNGKKK